MPKISAVIPVYNVEAFLPLCIESALHQTLEDIEIICVDDGSTDNCPHMLDEYASKDKRVKVIHQPNGGYGKAMNAGLRVATGEYFAVLESDDFILPDAYEVLYNAAKRYDADVIRADYFDFTTYNRRPNLKLKQITQDYTMYNRLICPNREQKVYSYVMHNWTGIHRISFLREKNIWYNETPGASYQDNGFYFQVFTQTERLVYIPRGCYCYRIDNPTSSIHNPNKVYTMTEEYEFIHRFISKHPEFEKEIEPAFYARLFRAYHQTYMRIGEEFRAEFAQFFRNTFVEIRDKHLINTTLMTKGERELLIVLLDSTELYQFMATNHPHKRLSKATLTELKIIDHRTGWRGVVRRFIPHKGKKQRHWLLSRSTYQTAWNTLKKDGINALMRKISRRIGGRKNAD
ncbi:MAG: glycosyltransferase family 2 protein [Clostridia bacterium]|nr:glycosyltransferase family 2 protein [Clostridia bacterium]